MKKITAIILAALMLISAACFGVSAAEKADGYLIYSEDFEGDTYEGWDAVGDGSNLNITVQEASGNKSLRIQNTDETININDMSYLSHLSVIPESVMNEYIGQEYTVEYDMTFVANQSGQSYAGAGITTCFDGSDTNHWVFPVFRTCGRGNGWCYYVDSNNQKQLMTVDSGTQLSNNTWLGTVTGGEYTYNSTTAPYGQIGCKLSIRIQMTATGMTVSAKYNDTIGYKVISTTSNNADFNICAARSAGIGFAIWSEVTVDVDNVRAYKGIDVDSVEADKYNRNKVLYSECFENDAEYESSTDKLPTGWTNPTMYAGYNQITEAYAIKDGRLHVSTYDLDVSTANTKNAFATIVPMSVMDEYMTSVFSIEYDVTFVNSKLNSGGNLPGFAVATRFDENGNCIVPLLRADGTGNGWWFGNASDGSTTGWMETYDGADLSGAKWSSNIGVEASKGSFVLEGKTISVKMVSTSDTLTIYVKNTSGEWAQISEGTTTGIYTDGYKGNAIGMVLQGGLEVALDNIKVYTGTTAPDDFRYAGYQLANTESDTSEAIRFLATVDNYDSYSRLGMKVTAIVNGVSGNTVDRSSDVVYHSVNENVNGVTSSVSAETLGGEFIFAAELKAFPRQDVTFRIELYYIDIDGSQPISTTEIWTLHYDADTRQVTETVTVAD